MRFGFVVATVFIVAEASAIAYLARLEVLESQKKQHTQRSLQIVQTAYMIYHAGANPYDTITFPVPAGAGNIWVHFPLQSPCKSGPQDLPGTPAKPPTCVVNATADAPYVGQYPYYIDSNAGVPLAVAQGRCRSCCMMCQIVIPNPRPNLTSPEEQYAIKGNGLDPAVEVLIDQKDSGFPWSQIVVALQGQPVKWFRPGNSNLDWSVHFDDPTPCIETDIKSGTGHSTSQVCTVRGPAKTTPYIYTMKIGNKSASGQLYVR